MKGNPKQIINTIDNIPRKWKYTSGAITFENNLKPDEETIQKVMDSFEKSACGRVIDQNDLPIIWVKHEDKGRVELHFVVARMNYKTGNDFNIKPPGKQFQQKWINWSKKMRSTLGLKEIKPKNQNKSNDRLKFESKKTPKRDSLEATCMKLAKNGTVKNRDELLAYLVKNFDAKITRKNNDYCSIKIGENKAVRFSEGIFKNDFDYSSIAQPNTIQAKVERYRASTKLPAANAPKASAGSSMDAIESQLGSLQARLAKTTDHFEKKRISMQIAQLEEQLRQMKIMIETEKQKEPSPQSLGEDPSKNVSKSGNPL